MKDNRIRLEFNATVTRLAGFGYGEAIYKEQVDGKVDFAKDVYLEFPEGIIKIASSFVQGFFKGIIEQVGLESIGESVHIVTMSDALTASIINNLV